MSTTHARGVAALGLLGLAAFVVLFVLEPDRPPVADASPPPVVGGPAPEPPPDALTDVSPHPGAARVPVAAQASAPPAPSAGEGVATEPAVAGPLATATTRLEIEVVDSASGGRVTHFEATWARRSKPRGTSDGTLAADVEFVVGQLLPVEVSVPLGSSSEARATLEVEPVAGGTTVAQLAVDLHRPPPGAAVVTGRVVDSETSAPLGGAVVIGFDNLVPSEPLSMPSLTLEDGRFAVDVSAVSGPVALDAGHPAYDAPLERRRASAGDVIELRLTPRASLAVRALDRDGAPMADAPVRLFAIAFDGRPPVIHPWVAREHEARADAAGVATFEDLLAGEYVAVLVDEDDPDDELGLAHRPVTVERGVATEVDLAPPAGATVTVTGVVTGPGIDGRAVPGFVGHDAAGTIVEGVRDAGGYRAEGLVPGDYMVVLGPAQGVGRPAAPRAILPRVVIGTASEQRLDIAYPTGAIEARFVDGGAGVQQIALSPVLPPGFAATLAGRGIVSLTPTDSGAFTIEHVASGDWILWVLHDGLGRRELPVSVDGSGVRSLGELDVATWDAGE